MGPMLWVNALWAGVYAAAMAVVFTTPREYLLRTFTCGVAVRLSRDLLMAGGLDLNSATVGAAIIAVIVVALITPEEAVQPVVLVAAVLQLGAASAIFNVVVQVLRLWDAEGQELADASLKLLSGVGQTFSRFVAMAIGLEIGIVLVTLAGLRQRST